ncbi:MAG: hypothetical protein AB7E77_03685 [Desulfobulbus sp.]
MPGQSNQAGGTVKPSLRMAPLVAMAVFLVLLVIGITLDEPSRVLEQARSICLACIGIG